MFQKQLHYFFFILNALMAVICGNIYFSAKTYGQSASVENQNNSLAVKASSPNEGPSIQDLLALKVEDLANLTIDELLNTHVVSAWSRSGKVGDTPAAIYVINHEDIQAIGARRIPELLRYAPGVQVARVNNSIWAITIRGFNGVYANKLLVLMDGRSVYSPFFAGTYWDSLDYILHDIEQIEIVRGPGSSTWGSNANNGVINIVTKNAKETQGEYASIGFGSSERAFFEGRYGGKVKENIYYRVYNKCDYFDKSYWSKVPSSDAWKSGRCGFRVDWEATDLLTLSAFGDLYGGRSDQVVDFPSINPFPNERRSIHTNYGGGNLSGRLNRTFCNDAQMSWRLDYDYTDRDIEKIYAEIRNTVDLKLDYTFMLGDRHHFAIGGEYKYTQDKIENTDLVQLNPDKKAIKMVSAFAQDDIDIIDERLILSLGARIEHSDYSDFEVQPTVRFLYKRNESHTFWGALSRAVRVPWRIGREGAFTIRASQIKGIPGTVQVVGDQKLKSEELIAFELGYRAKLSDAIFLDTTGFYNIYDHLVTLTTTTSKPVFYQSPRHFQTKVAYGNPMKADVYGIEVAANWYPFEWWCTKMGYSFMKLKIHLLEGANPSGKDIEHETPQQQLFLISSLNINEHWRLSGTCRYVDSVSTPGRDDIKIGHYTAVDSQIRWKPTESLELSIVGQNLLKSHHKEFGEKLIQFVPCNVERGFYIQLTWSH